MGVGASTQTYVMFFPEDGNPSAGVGHGNINVKIGTVRRFLKEQPKTRTTSGELNSLKNK